MNRNSDDRARRIAETAAGSHQASGNPVSEDPQQLQSALALVRAIEYRATDIPVTLTREDWLCIRQAIRDDDYRPPIGQRLMDSIDKSLSDNQNLTTPIFSTSPGEN